MVDSPILCPRQLSHPEFASLEGSEKLLRKIAVTCWIALRPQNQLESRRAGERRRGWAFSGHPWAFSGTPKGFFLGSWDSRGKKKLRRAGRRLLSGPPANPRGPKYCPGPRVTRAKGSCEEGPGCGGPKGGRAHKEWGPKTRKRRGPKGGEQKFRAFLPLLQ